MTEHKCDAHTVLKLFNDKITSLTDIIETQRKFIDKLTTMCESQQDTIKKLIDNAQEKKTNTMLPPSAPELPPPSAPELTPFMNPTQLCSFIQTIYVMYDKDENNFFIRIHVKNCEMFPIYLKSTRTLDLSAWGWHHLDKYFGYPAESAVYAITLEKYERLIKPYTKIQPIINMLSTHHYFKKMIKSTNRVVGGISIEFKSAITPMIIQIWSSRKDGIIYNESNFTLYVTQDDIYKLGLSDIINTSSI